MLVDSHSILSEWMSHFCKSLNVRRGSDARQAGIQIGKQLLALRFRWLLRSRKDANGQVLNKFQQKTKSTF